MKVNIIHKMSRKHVDASYCTQEFSDGIGLVIANFLDFTHDIDGDIDIIIQHGSSYHKSYRANGLFYRWYGRDNKPTVFVYAAYHANRVNDILYTLGHELGHAVQWYTDRSNFDKSQWDLENEAQVYGSMFSEQELKPISNNWKRNLINRDRRAMCMPRKYDY